MKNPNDTEEGQDSRNTAILLEVYRALAQGTCVRAITMAEMMYAGEDVPVYSPGWFMISDLGLSPNTAVALLTFIPDAFKGMRIPIPLAKTLLFFAFRFVRPPPTC